MAHYFFKLTIVTSLILLGLGVCLLYHSASSGGLPELLGGAVVITLGILLMSSQTRLVLRHAALHQQNRPS